MKTAVCSSILTRGRMVPPFSLLSCALFFYRKAPAFFARKHCWAQIRKFGRDLGYSHAPEGRVQTAHRAMATISKPSNPSRAFARVSRSQRQKSSKDIFVPPASSRARTGQHFDLCREHRAAVSRQEIRKFRSAFPACDLENRRTSRF